MEQEVYGAGMAPSFAALAYEEISSGMTVYSAYPIADIDNREKEHTAVTFSGVPGTFAPVSVTGCAEVLDTEKKSVVTEKKGSSLLLTIEGGGTYYFLAL